MLSCNVLFSVTLGDQGEAYTVFCLAFRAAGQPDIMTINYAAPFPACDLYGRAAAFVNDSLAMGDLDE